MNNVQQILIYEDEGFQDSQETSVIYNINEKEDIINLWKLKTFQILIKKPSSLEKVFHQQCLDILMISYNDDYINFVQYILELVFFILACICEFYFEDKKNNIKFTIENEYKNENINEKTNNESKNIQNKIKSQLNKLSDDENVAIFENDTILYNLENINENQSINNTINNYNKDILIDNSLNLFSSFSQKKININTNTNNDYFNNHCNNDNNTITKGIYNIYYTLVNPFYKINKYL